MSRQGALTAALLAAALLVAAVASGPFDSAAAAFDHFLVGATGPAPTAPPPIVEHQGQGLPVPFVLAYYDASQGAKGISELKSLGSSVNGIVPFWYTIHADGSVTGSADPAVLTYAAKRHLWVFALVQNMTGPSVYHSLFTNPVARQRALQSLLGLVESEGYDGLNLDFEGISPGDRAGYTAFVQDLSSLLHENGYYLTLSLPAETKDSPSDPWSGAYDYKALGQWADLVMVMAYDQHYSGSQAGPVAGKTWVENVVRYATGTIPNQKLVLGIPGYGYDWGPSGGKAITYQQWQALVKRYASGGAVSGHLTYVQNGVKHSVYFEDQQAMEAAVKLAAGYNLRGIVIWRIGIENPAIWPWVRS